MTVCLMCSCDLYLNLGQDDVTGTAGNSLDFLKYIQRKIPLLKRNISRVKRFRISAVAVWYHQGMDLNEVDCSHTLNKYV